MDIGRTSNPALNAQTFSAGGVTAMDQQMTVTGTVNKTAVMLALVVAAAAFTWRQFFQSGPQTLMPWMLIGGLGGFVVAMVTIFKKTWSPVTAPIYSILEGLFLGSLSAMFEARYPGIVLQAAGLTFATLFCLLGAYRSGMIKVTENFRLGVIAATGGIMLLYLVSFVLRMFTSIRIGFIHEGGPIGILFSLFVVGVAALNLVLDFDFIERGAEQGAPKFMEWYGAFGLIVTLIWLYIEMLRLLSKIRGRR